MSNGPRYTTFTYDELAQRLRELSPESSPVVTIPQSGIMRVTNHTFPVTFPDSQTGTCYYERKASRWHCFRYQYSDGIWMPYMNLPYSLSGDRETIEAKGQELAAGCYAEAVRREQKEYFQRAAEPADGSRKRRPEKYQMKVSRAKEYAGKYALCARAGEILMITSALFETIERANIAWHKENNPRLVVACCNRLDRCWELPKYNPLYAEYSPLRQNR